MNKETSNDKHCDYNNFKRANYFHGMLMTDRDFREEQMYHNEKRKMLNRMLHGWGVVCGLGISGKNKESAITISPGVALDCHGNEIISCEPYVIDLKENTCTGTTIIQRNPVTAEDCKQLEKIKDKSSTFYICIRYSEVRTDPVPVYAPGGGCEEKTCDYSRIREGFCIKIFDKPPLQPQIPGLDPSLSKRLFEKIKNDSDKNSLLETVMEFSDEFCRTPLSCPDSCPDEHYIILGKVEIDSLKKTIITISVKGDRTYVLTAHLYKYIFSSLFSGLDSYFEVEYKDKDGTEELPDINIIHTNPFEALCLIRQIVLKEAKIRPKPNVEMEKVNLQLIALKKELDEIKTKMEPIQKKSAKKR